MYSKRLLYQNDILQELFSGIKWGSMKAEKIVTTKSIILELIPKKMFIFACTYIFREWIFIHHTRDYLFRLYLYIFLVFIEVHSFSSKVLKIVYWEIGGFGKLSLEQHSAAVRTKILQRRLKIFIYYFADNQVFWKYIGEMEENWS